MSEVRTVAIVGLGLIGGSLAREFAARGLRVLAFDRNEATVRSAIAEGVVTSAATLESLHEADVLIIATPVDVSARVLADIAPRLAPHTIITDACSTKCTLERAAIELGLGLRYVGAHPMAGDTCSGWATSRAGLFRGASVYLCPTHETSDYTLRIVRDLWSSVGCVPEIIDAREHDALVASTSHLPQVTATALARTLEGTGIPLSRLGPGGRDMTRLARSSAEIWTAIALDNSAAIVNAVRQMEGELARLRTALEHGDAAGVQAFFGGKPA